MINILMYCWCAVVALLIVGAIIYGLLALIDYLLEKHQ